MADHADQATGGVRSISGSGEAVPEVLTVDEAALLLRVNRKTIYDALRRSGVPGARRIGGVIRIHRETLVRWLASGGTISRPANGSVVRSRSHTR